ncbi:hypothetical protein SDC9_128943 [bioreactor metagenome]|uniref:Uncharacterized protein n=1 Tax=bioreactor metagenome TaxID=1076179 RepID=A0A645CXM5_9ZZZZ
MQVLCHCVDLCNEENTSLNLPTVALYLSHALQEHHRQDKVHLPIHQLQKGVIHLYLSADSFQLREEVKEADLQVREQHRSEGSELWE